jgi:NDP-sugar pyrophosphorylase family protein
MKKIILLSGLSQRFIEQGYPIKPLIEVNGKQIIEWATQTVYQNEPNYKDYIFVVKDWDVVHYDIKNILQSKFNDCVVEVIPQHNLGPVFSLKQLTVSIDLNEEIVICYCDLFVNWNFTEFVDFAEKENCDGIIASHNDWHPHRIYNNYFAYMRVDGNNVLEIQEKKHFTNDPIQEPASSGIYYFKTFKMMQKYLNELLNLNIKINNEFYVTMIYNLMIRDNLKVCHYLSDNYVCLGTPKDVEILKGCSLLFNHLSDNNIDYNKIVYYYKQHLAFN